MSDYPVLIGADKIIEIEKLYILYCTVLLGCLLLSMPPALAQPANQQVAQGIAVGQASAERNSAGQTSTGRASPEKTSSYTEESFEDEGPLPTIDGAGVYPPAPAMTHPFLNQGNAQFQHHRNLVPMVPAQQLTTEDEERNPAPQHFKDSLEIRQQKLGNFLGGSSTNFARSTSERAEPGNAAQPGHSIQAAYPAHASYSPQSGMPALSGYPAQPGHSIQSGIPALSGDPAQAGIPALSGYQPQSVIPGLSGYSAPGMVDQSVFAGLSNYAGRSGYLSPSTGNSAGDMTNSTYSRSAHFVYSYYRRGLREEKRAYSAARRADHEKDKARAEIAANEARYAARTARYAYDRIYRASKGGDQFARQYVERARYAAERAQDDANRAQEDANRVTDDDAH